MARLQVAHTATLDDDMLGAARALLEGVFVGEFRDSDWEHCLGGVHALLWQGAELIGHASVVPRRLSCGGRVLRAAYVEGVAVRADRRRRGHAGAMMDRLERVIRRSYDLGALGATDEAAAFYAARGWQRWQGPSSAETLAGVIRTPAEDDCIWVLPGDVPLDFAAELTCDWRDGELW